MFYNLQTKGLSVKMASKSEDIFLDRPVSTSGSVVTPSSSFAVYLRAASPIYKIYFFGGGRGTTSPSPSSPRVGCPTRKEEEGSKKSAWGGDAAEVSPQKYIAPSTTNVDPECRLPWDFCVYPGTIARPADGLELNPPFFFVPGKPLA